MKKELLFISSIFLFVCLGILFWKGKGENILPYTFEIEGHELCIKPWLDQEEHGVYLFLPAFLRGADVSEYEKCSVAVMRSENLPAVFISTESRKMDYLLKDKDYKEAGEMTIIGAEGNLRYSGRLERISGRGNTSWKDYAKKPYAVRLEQPDSLLGMQDAVKWLLLPVWREGNRMNTRIAFDMAKAMGLEDTPDFTWIDLYLNGEYAGNYLLCEPVTVEEVSTDTEGSFLLEKDLNAYFASEPYGFRTDSGRAFTIHIPDPASEEEIASIRELTQKAENAILSLDAEYPEFIDMDSFAARFLVDEISLNLDANITSMYFYKRSEEDRLYGGPVWDYDGAMGDVNSGYMEGRCVDYTGSTLEPFRSEDETLQWNAVLYEDERFRKRVLEIYRSALPEFENLLEVKIDEYAEQVRASALMDRVRWQNEDTDDDYPGHYREFDNNVRYLKYFLANRLNYLNGIWEVDYRQLEAPINNEIHQVIFTNGKQVVETRSIADGETITEPPALDENIYLGWYYEHSHEKLRSQIPVYEDIVLFARKK